MNVYNVVRCIIDAKGEEDVGRTSIQKLVYLAQNAMPTVIEQSTYQPHYYGPFSSEVGLVLEKLVSYSFIAESKIHGKLYAGYRYELTSTGKEIIEKVKQEDKDAYNQLKEFVDVCRKFCSLKATPLSFASKVLYMVKARENEKKPISFQEAVDDAKDLGWEITLDEVKNGTDLLQELKLVRVS